ncbi:MAG: DIP1984 family protein [Chromatiaceae bacterium]|nr:DIP1984 family protein [Chromatiaceae bacterium]MCF8004196.1 DIP1984 family protein [Chromatiaceae bacterium]MCF8015821.1 DIP1984 family protein [Chromatiaceae bacterium]
MKLAEALIERKAIKTKIEEIKKRIYQNSQVQEGDQPTESPLTLITELNGEVEKLEVIIIRINNTNNEATLDDGMNLMEALTKRDMLRYKQFILSNLADKATPSTDRYSQREIKFVPTVPITDIRQQSDNIAKECRLLDTKIQQANWTIDLL